MNMKSFQAEATRINNEFLALRKQLVAVARTKKGHTMIKSVDASAARKLNWFVSDITPSRLVSISKKLMEKGK